MDQLQEVRQDLASRLQALENLDQAPKDAKQKVETTQAAYVKMATKLSSRRQSSAKKLDIANEDYPTSLGSHVYKLAEKLLKE